MRKTIMVAIALCGTAIVSGCGNEGDKNKRGPLKAISEGWNKAQQGAASGASAMRGRNLFVGITQANTEREAAGLDGVWPRTAGNLSGDKNDIAGIDFKNSTEYFKVLFDMASFGKANWQPRRFFAEGGRNAFVRRFHSGGGYARNGQASQPF